MAGILPRNGGFVRKNSVLQKPSYSHQTSADDPKLKDDQYSYSQHHQSEGCSIKIKSLPVHIILLTWEHMSFTSPSQAI